MNVTPRYTRAEMTTMSAAGTVKNGTIVYCTDLNCNFSFENGIWVPGASSKTVNTQTASYTLALTDQNQIVRTNVGSATTVQCLLIQPYHLKLVQE